MSFTKDMITKGTEAKCRKVLLYGPPKIGKSTLAASAPDTLVVRTEDRMDHIDSHKTKKMESMEEIYEVFDFLMVEKHPYKQLVIDTIDWLEPMLHDYICRKNGWKHITDDHNKETAFFKGLKYHAVAGWRKFLDNLDYLRIEKGISIILVSHSAVIKVDPPDSESYDKEVMKIDKNAIAVLEEWADIIGFYQREIFVTKDKNAKAGKATSSKRRILRLGGDNPAFISGNSYNLPDEIEVNLEDTSGIMEYILTGKGE